jgi:GPH family glycoside/pentoside/hexuronide:cation symporter
MLYGSIGWANMGILFGIITLVSLGLSYIGSREDPTYSEGEGLSIGKSIAATFKNKSFLTYVIAAMFLQFTFVMLQAGIPFYAKYVLKIEDGFLVSLLLGSIFISAMVFVGLWSWRANKKGSKNTMIISSIIYGIALIPFWFVRDYIGAVITAVVLGFGLAGLMILLDVMISDIVDEDEIKTGARREGMYFGVNGFMVRLGISVQSVLMGYILSTSGYDANLAIGAQPESALIGIKSLITIVPIVSLVFAVLFFSLYPLHGDRLREVKEKMVKLHGE